MHRIQVQLTAEQERMLRELAELRGSSISALIREGIDVILAPGKEQRRLAWDRARAFVGRYDSGTTDTAENHDDALAEAFLSRYDEPE
jgi:Arc/MetJ-type ribon-helix-helix transcriptional regulator